MEKQHNRARWCRFCKYKTRCREWERYISRVRSNHAQPIQDVFAQINDRINEEMAHPEYGMMWLCKNKNPIFRRIVLAMLWDFGKTVSKAYILLRQNNWMHRNLIGNLT
jgi:amidophosphoribosyltransferase